LDWYGVGVGFEGGVGLSVVEEGCVNGWGWVGQWSVVEVLGKVGGWDRVGWDRCLGGCGVGLGVNEGWWGGRHIGTL